MNIPIRGRHHTEDGVSQSIKAAAQAGGRNDICYPTNSWGWDRRILDTLHHEGEYSPVTTYSGDDLVQLGYNGV